MPSRIAGLALAFTLALAGAQAQAQAPEPALYPYGAKLTATVTQAGATIAEVDGLEAPIVRLPSGKDAAVTFTIDAAGPVLGVRCFELFGKIEILGIATGPDTATVHFRPVAGSPQPIACAFQLEPEGRFGREVYAGIKVAVGYNYRLPSISR